METNRRDLLRLGGALAATGTVMIGLGAENQAEAVVQAAPTSAKAPLPPLEVIALNRLAYGPRSGDLEAFRALPGANIADKYKAYVEQQLNPAAIDDSTCDTRLRGLDTLSKPIERLWAEHLRDLPEMDERYKEIWRPTQETRIATAIRALHSKRQLLEVTVDFWHNHFNIAPDRDERIAALFASYDTHIRRHALGNFRELLVGVAMHPVMLYYLDNASSSRAGPNENWARELFELHTLGSENYLGVKRQKEVPGYDKGQPTGYVDDDVYEATRAFTGWRVADNSDEPGMKNTGEFIFYAPWHDRFQKTMMGRQLIADQAGTKDGMDVLEILAAHPGTARHIARKLAGRFIADDPPERVVQEAAKVFQASSKSPNQIRDTLRVILFSDEFKTTYGEKIKRPLESSYSIMRALGTELVKLDKRDDILWHFGWAGQFLFGHRPPDGYPDRRQAWNGTAAMLRRWQFGQGLCENWWDFFKSDLTGQTPKEVTTPNQIADYWTRRTLGRPVSGAKRDSVVRFLTWNQDPDQPLSPERIKERLPRAVSLLFMMPEFLWR